MTLASCWPGLTKADPGAPIPAHQSSYWVYYNNEKIGEMDFVLEPANETVWHVRTQTKATTFLAKTLGSNITEAAHFVWTEDAHGIQVLPLNYHHVSREPLRTRFWQHHYDWDALQVTLNTHEGEFSTTLKEGLLDPLTLRLALASRLAQQGLEDLGDDQAWDFWVLDRDDIESQQMQYRGPEVIEVNAGCFNTEHFYRLRKEGSSRNYDLWVAKSYAWLPIRILQNDGNKALSIELFSTTLFDTPTECQ